MIKPINLLFFLGGWQRLASEWRGEIDILCNEVTKKWWRDY